MKIKFTNLTLLNVIDTLAKFENITGKLGYAITTTNDDIKEKIKPFYIERSKLFDKYKCDDDNGNFYIDQNSENYEAYKKEMTDILDMVVQVEVYQISPEDFHSSDYYSELASVRDYEIIKALFIKQASDEDVAE